MHRCSPPPDQKTLLAKCPRGREQRGNDVGNAVCDSVDFGAVSKEQLDGLIIVLNFWELPVLPYNGTT